MRYALGIELSASLDLYWKIATVSSSSPNELSLCLLLGFMVVARLGILYCSDLSPMI